MKSARDILLAVFEQIGLDRDKDQVAVPEPALMQYRVYPPRPLASGMDYGLTWYWDVKPDDSICCFSEISVLDYEGMNGGHFDHQHSFTFTEAGDFVEDD